MKSNIVSAAACLVTGLAVGSGVTNGPEGQITVTNGQVALGENGMHPPFAYGKIAENGSIISASPNITGVSVSTGKFTISIAGGFQSSDIVIASDARFNRATVMNAWITGGVLEITCWNTVGVWEQRDDVSFVVYRP